MWSAFILLFVLGSASLALSHPRHVFPIRLQSLQNRASEEAGILPVSLTDDKQSVLVYDMWINLLNTP